MGVSDELPRHQAQPLQLVDAVDDPGDGAAVSAVLVDRVRLALGSLDPEAPPSSVAEEADAVRGAILAMTGAAAGTHDDRKRLLWSAVASARSELKALERHGAVEGAGSRSVAPNAAAIAAVERAWAAVDAARARAERKLASPGSFRKLVEAKRQAQDVLEAHGFESVEAYRGALEAPSDVSGGAGPRVDARRAVEDAEATWDAFVAKSPGQLAASTEADALRARAYRVLGRVVDDVDLVPALTELIDRVEADRSVRQLLRSALAQAGVDDGGNPVAAAQAWLDAAAPR